MVGDVHKTALEDGFVWGAKQYCPRLPRWVPSLTLPFESLTTDGRRSVYRIPCSWFVRTICSAPVRSIAYTRWYFTRQSDMYSD